MLTEIFYYVCDVSWPDITNFVQCNCLNFCLYVALIGPRLWFKFLVDWANTSKIQLIIQQCKFTFHVKITFLKTFDYSLKSCWVSRACRKNAYRWFFLETSPGGVANFYWALPKKPVRHPQNRKIRIFVKQKLNVFFDWFGVVDIEK